MVRVWRKSAKLLTKINDFMAQYASPEQKKDFETAVASLMAVMNNVETNVEDNIISDLKERV